MEKVMTDESVAPGEQVVTSGGDQIFPNPGIVQTGIFVKATCQDDAGK